MSYRQIHSQIWKDPWFIELEADLKLLFIYLFSNELATLSGIYQIPLRVIAFETDLPIDRVREGLAKFEADGKVFYDAQRSLVWVKNLRKYNTHGSSSPKIARCIEEQLEAIPDCPLKQRYLAYYSAANADPPSGVMDPEAGDTDEQTAASDGYPIADSGYPIDTLSIPHHTENRNSNSKRTETEIDTLSGGAGAPRAEPQSRISFDQLKHRLSAAKNKAAELYSIATELFPESELDFKLGPALAKKAGGWGRALEILWQLAPRPPTGEVFRYAIAVACHRARDRPSDGTYEHKVAEVPPGFTFEV